MHGLLERIFKLQQYGTDPKTEILAGTTTFLTMSYIIFVNPMILGKAGMPQDAVFVATCLGAGLVTMAMGFFVNYPIALAPSMGLNAFYAYNVILAKGISWEIALGAVFISGLVFLLMTLTHVREMIVNALPPSLKVAITSGIGLFIAFIGLKEAGIVAHNDATFVTMGNLGQPAVIAATIGLLLTAVLMARHVKGAVYIGIIAATAIGAIFSLFPIISIDANTLAEAQKIVGEGTPVLQSGGKFYQGLTHIPSGWSDFFKSPPSLAPTFLKLDIMGALKMGLLDIILTFTFVELFDTLGTLVGTLSQAGLQSYGGKFPRIGRAMLVDASGISLGALLGTSTITAYIESGSGVAEGGRTGLTAVTTGFWFLLAIVFGPVARIIPIAATAPALIIVGVLMANNIRKVNFDDITEGLPAFVTLVGMPFTFSIANGIAAGFISYTFLKLFTGQWRKVHPIIYIITALFFVRFAFIS